MRVKLGKETKEFRTVWMEGSIVKMIDQPKLPHKFEVYSSYNHKQTAEAIKRMVVRGAPAIGVTAAYGLAQACLEASEDEFDEYVRKAAQTLKNTRPTAQNLFWAIDRVLNAMEKGSSVMEKRELALKEANKIAEEDVETCRKIGEHGKKLIKDGDRILTHCNAGALATVDYGTALAPIRFAHYEGKKIFVLVDETRPRCQGSRLTAWELLQEGIDHAIIVDNAAGYYMQKGDVDICIVGADRVAADGSVANKIGTYEKAVLAKENGIPFYVAVPTSTIDLNIKSGKDIPIEERKEEEVTHMWGNLEGKLKKIRISPEGSGAFNPAFDVTPAKYITGLITERGIISPNKVKDLFER
jgi:translation initiation factor eIF-2B subunit alpha/methylthioribose-1-phosphate isomerase